MATGRRAAAWGAWFGVVFVLFNSCAGHRETWDTGVWLSSGQWTPGPTLALRGIRAACNDDGNINRYLAYANAVLGLPYQAYYVQPLAAWKAEPVDETQDYNDPAVVPPMRPEHALVPYRDFSVEYPPGFFPFAILPRLLSSDLDVYRIAFSAWMGLLLSIALWLSLKIAERAAPLRAQALVPRATWVALAMGVILVRRYDATVAVSLCVLVWACLARKPVMAGVGLGAGVAAKLVPGLVAPLAVAYWLTRRRWREAIVATVTALGTFGAFCGLVLAAAGSRVLELFAYHAGRPFEVESTGGALLILSRLFAPSRVTLSKAFGSSGAVAAWDAPLKRCTVAVLVLTLGYIMIWAAHRMREEPDDRAAALLLSRASCAVMAAWMLFGMVFSPQYLTWLVPLGVLVSVVDGRRTLGLFLGTLALTQVIYPFAFKAGDLVESLSPWFGILVLLRNALLFVWALSIVRSGARIAPARLVGHASPARRG
jgi:hypothetical protein